MFDWYNKKYVILISKYLIFYQTLDYIITFDT